MTAAIHAVGRQVKKEMVDMTADVVDSHESDEADVANLSTHSVVREARGLHGWYVTNIRPAVLEGYKAGSYYLTPDERSAVVERITGQPQLWAREAFRMIVHWHDHAFAVHFMTEAAGLRPVME